MMQDKITKLGLFVFLFGTVFYIYDFFSQVFPSVITNQLIHDFGLNATSLGVLSSIYFYTCVVMQIPAGLLLDRFGVKIIISSAMIISSIGILLFSFASSIALAFFARFLMGLGASFAFVGALYIIANWLPIKYFACFVGITQMFASVGAIFGQIPLAYYATHFGWRSSIGFFSIIELCFGVLFFVVLKYFSSKKENIQKNKSKFLDSFKKVLSNKQNWCIAIYTFFTWAPISFFAALWGIPFLVAVDGISKVKAAGTLSCLWIGVAIGSPIIGWLSDYVGLRKPLLFLPEVIGLFAASALVLVKMPVIILSLLLFVLGIAASGQVLSFAVVFESNDASISSVANGFNNIAAFMSGALLQPLVGYILDLSGHGSYGPHDYKVAMLILPVCYFIGMIMVYYITETGWRRRHTVPI